VSNKVLTSSSWCALQAYLNSWEARGVLHKLQKEIPKNAFMVMDGCSGQDGGSEEDMQPTAGFMSADGGSTEALVDAEAKLYSLERKFKKPEEQLAAVQKERAEFQRHIDKNGLTVDKIEHAVDAVCECLFDAAEMLVLMLAADHVCFLSLSWTCSLWPCELVQPLCEMMACDLMA
jgi:hypothetical protein